mmetsp:Transcript_87684/g.234780  ORF Transcript_87684/g.234780 Transcript_87684/m.234780 type:complete len:307 (-) Transcript_87684:237-1157(-)
MFSSEDSESRCVEVTESASSPCCLSTSGPLPGASAPRWLWGLFAAWAGLWGLAAAGATAFSALCGPGPPPGLPGLTAAPSPAPGLLPPLLPPLFPDPLWLGSTPPAAGGCRSEPLLDEYRDEEGDDTLPALSPPAATTPAALVSPAFADSLAFPLLLDSADSSDAPGFSVSAASSFAPLSLLFCFSAAVPSPFCSSFVPRCCAAPSSPCCSSVSPASAPSSTFSATDEELALSELDTCLRLLLPFFPLRARPRFPLFLATLPAFFRPLRRRTGSLEDSELAVASFRRRLTFFAFAFLALGLVLRTR